MENKSYYHTYFMKRGKKKLISAFGAAVDIFIIYSLQYHSVIILLLKNS